MNAIKSYVFVFVLAVLMVAGSSSAYAQYMNLAPVYGTATANQQWGNSAPWAIDGDDNTSWNADGWGIPTSPKWLTVTLNGLYEVDKIVVKAHASNVYNLYISTDGTNWQLMASGTFGGGSVQSHEITIPPFNPLQYAKYEVVGGSDYAHLNEMEIYGNSPIAEAGPDQVVFDTVALDGSASTGSVGSIVAYDWVLKYRGNSAYDQTASGMAPTISGLNTGFYDVTLTVTDEGGLTRTDTMLLAAAGPGFPSPNANLVLNTFKIIKNKKSGNTTTSMSGAIPDLPQLSLLNGSTVKSRITIELLNALTDGKDLVATGEATLNVTDTNKTLTIAK